MKNVKILILFMTSLICFNAYSQDTVKVKQKSKVHAYLSPGVSISTGVPCYGMEIGIYTDKIWLASTTETYRNSDTKKYDILQGIRFYYNYYTPIKDQLFLYFNTAAKITCNKSKVLIFEPGTCIVYSPHKNIGLQFGCSIPISETCIQNKVFPFSTGLCFNVYL